MELAYIERPGVDNSMMKFKLEYGTQPRTSELTMASTDRQVQTALEAVTGGPGSVTVTASDEIEIVAAGPNKGKTRVFRRYLITIPLRNSTPAKLPIKLDVVSKVGNFGDLIEWNVNNATSLISPNEYAMFFTDADRNKFAKATLKVFEDAFKPFVDRGEIVIHPEGLPGADYNVNWTSSASELYGLDVGVSVGYEKLEDLVRKRTKLNPAQQSFLLAEARDIEHKGQNGGKTGIEAYVDNHFEFFYPFWDTPFDIVTQEQIYGAFISHAAIVIDPNSQLSLSGLIAASGAIVPLINRSTITVGSTRTLTIAGPVSNEGQITVNGGTMTISTDSIRTFTNSGVINQTSGRVTLQSLSDSTTIPPEKLKTADLGAFNVSGGFVHLRDRFELDNSNSTLMIDGTSQWYLEGGATISGGTIQVAPTAQLRIGGNHPAAVLKDVTVNGNTLGGFIPLALVGDVDFNGTVTGGPGLQFGHASLYAGVPLIIRGGSFEFGAPGGATLQIIGTTGPLSVTLEADVVLKARKVNATLTQPLTNRGQIIADAGPGAFTDADRLFDFTVAPITNEGALSATRRGILRINNLAAPSSGVVSAAVDSKVEFVGAFAQTAAGTTRIDISGTASTQFGLVVVGAGATLDGTLNVQFAIGYTPTVGSSFKVLTYASRIGTFATVNVTGLASGLKVTPQYNGTDMTLVISAG